VILQGRSTEDNGIIRIHLEKERISRIERLKREPRPAEKDLYVSPGFVDLQVNGFAGVDFNDKDLTTEDIHKAAQSIKETGVTTFFPTLITASFDRMVRQLKILHAAIDSDSFVSRACKGIHLEGPYISPSQRARGIHPLKFIRPPAWEELERLQEASGGRVRMITLAPETEGALEFIEKAVSKGVVVAVGHTAAPSAILEAAHQAGASLSTHLGNAMGDDLQGRHALLQKQLSMDGLMASIIVDGIHLPAEEVKDIVRAKDPDRILLTTDATAGACRPPGTYRFADLEIETFEDGRTRCIGTERRAGSTLTMPRAITNLINFSGIDLSAAIRTVTENPNRLFPGLTGTLSPDQPADIVLFRFDGDLKIEKVIQAGC